MCFSHDVQNKYKNVCVLQKLEALNTYFIKTFLPWNIHSNSFKFRTILANRFPSDLRSTPSKCVSHMTVQNKYKNVCVLQKLEALYTYFISLQVNVFIA